MTEDDAARILKVSDAVIQRFERDARVLRELHQLATEGVTPAPPTADTFYIATDGDDAHSGTIAAPWRTISYGLAKLKAGQRVLLRGGVYRGAENTIDSQAHIVPNGLSWDQLVTIGGYPGEPVTIQPPEGYHGLRLSATPASCYLLVQDLAVDLRESLSLVQSGPEGIYLDEGSHHNRFLRVDVSHAPSFGVAFSNNNGAAHSNEVLACKIHHNGLPGGAATNGHGLYLATADNRVEDSEIFENQGYGLHLFNNAGPKDVSRNSVRRNYVHHNGRHGGTAYGVVVAWGEDNMVEDNTFDRNPGGVMVYVESQRAQIRRNTISNSVPLEGIFIQYAFNTIIQGNTLFGNATDIVDLGTDTVIS